MVARYHGLLLVLGYCARCVFVKCSPPAAESSVYHCHRSMRECSSFADGCAGGCCDTNAALLCNAPFFKSQEITQQPQKAVVEKVRGTPQVFYLTGLAAEVKMRRL